MESATLVRTLITGALLLAFIAVFFQEALSIWRKQKPPENEARTYVWTAISVLVGSVTAFALGVKFPDHNILASVSPDDRWRAIYALVYTVLGLIAVVTWAVRTDYASTLMKNLATTFLGIAIPVVSSWLVSAPTTPATSISLSTLTTTAPAKSFDANRLIYEDASFRHSRPNSTNSTCHLKVPEPG